MNDDRKTVKGYLSMPAFSKEASREKPIRTGPAGKLSRTNGEIAAPRFSGIPGNEIGRQR